jgi:hypothetical protein
VARKSLLLQIVEFHVSQAPKRTPDASLAATAVFESVNRAFPSSHSHRALVDALVSRVFDRAVELIAVGQYPMAYVEMHALLEETAIALLSRRIAAKEYREVVADLLKRKTLTDVAPYYEDVGYWSRSDVSFVRKLAGIRNGVAHRNFDLLAKHIPRHSGNERHLDEFHFDLDKATEALSRVISLMVQIARTHKRKYRGRRVAA